MNNGVAITENLTIPFASFTYEKARKNRAILIRKQEIYITNYIVEKIKEAASKGNYSYSYSTYGFNEFDKEVMEHVISFFKRAGYIVMDSSATNDEVVFYWDKKDN